jgi:hypothetical protein
VSLNAGASPKERAANKATARVAAVCPFAIIQTSSEREVVSFESDNQAESVDRGKASFQDY